MRNLIKKTYRFMLGRLPFKLAIYIDYIRTHGKKPNLKDPKTFSEKMQYVKINRYLEKYTYLVDKYQVREYIKSKIGKEFLNELIDVYDSVDDIKFDLLPESFVLKLNNGSGFNFICKNKKDVNFYKLKKELAIWLKKDFYKENKEIQYKGIKNKIICEKYLEDSSGNLKDYKFFCFNGKVDFIQVDNDRFGEHSQNMYDINWNKKELNFGYKESKVLDLKPEHLEEMIFLAEKLSDKIPFVRIDFYYVNQKIYFGEFTFTPQNGLIDFKPEVEDKKIANMINIENYN